MRRRLGGGDIRSSIKVNMAATSTYFFVIAASILASLASLASITSAYTDFEPPVIFPEIPYYMAKAGQTARIKCQGSLGGVSWRLPADSNDDLRSRVNVYYVSNHRYHVANLIVHDLNFTDTGTFVCAYNGTTDFTAIDNATSVHLYVDDDTHLLKTSGFDFLQAVQSQTFVLPCMPTHPDVNVTLLRGHEVVQNDRYISYDPKVGFRISPVTVSEHLATFECLAQFKGRNDSYIIDLMVREKTAYIPRPHIDQTMARHVRKGDAFTLKCSVTVDLNSIVELGWHTPNPRAIADGRLITPDTISRNFSLSESHLKIVEQTLTVERSTKEDQGIYECTVEDHARNRQSKSEFIRIMEEAESYLRIYFEGYQTMDYTIGQDDGKKIQWVVQIQAHPQPTVEWYGPDGRKIDPRHSRDFTIKTHKTPPNSRTMLRVNKLSLSKAGTYTVRVFNEANETKTENFTLIVRSEPTVHATALSPQGLYKLGQEYTLKCSVQGFPLPEITWLFKPCTTYNDCNATDYNRIADINQRRHRTGNTFSRVSVIREVARRSGQFICQSCNKINCKYDVIPFFVTDVPDGGFSVNGPDSVLVGQDTTLRCSASRYNFSAHSLEWYKDTLSGDKLMTSSVDNHLEVHLTQTDFSYTKELVVHNITLRDRGRYVCRARLLEAPYTRTAASTSSGRRRSYNSGGGTHFYGQDNLQQEIDFNLDVLPLEHPLLIDTNLKPEVNKKTQPLLVKEPEDGLKLFCRVSGRPRPRMEWYLNGNRLRPNTTRIQLTDDDQVVKINYVSPRDEGLYECKAENRVGSTQAAHLVRLQSTLDRERMYAKIHVPVIVAVAVALFLVILLIIVASCCYNYSKKKKGSARCSSSGSTPDRGRAWKDPPTPPTPRLTQYDMALVSSSRSTTNGDEDDECRVTLTNSNRDEGSISPVPTIQCGGPPVGGGHLCHCHMQPTYYPSSAMMPKCSICDFNVTMPPYGGTPSPPPGSGMGVGGPLAAAYATTTLGRPLLGGHHGQYMHYNNAHGGTLMRTRYDPGGVLGNHHSHRSRSHSPPRLSAEF